MGKIAKIEKSSVWTCPLGRQLWRPRGGQTVEGSRTGGGSCSDSVDREHRRSGDGWGGTDLREI